MYAVIETGGKQYRVELGTELEVELLDVEPGQAITLDRVLLVADGDDTAIGRPLVENAAVEAEVVRQDRGEKVIAFKYRPKARRRVKKGHRQALTVLRVTDVRLNGRSAAEAARQAEEAAKTERQRLEEAAARQAAEDAALAARLAARKVKATKAETEKAETEKAETKPRTRRAKATAGASTEPAEPATTEPATTGPTEATAETAEASATDAIETAGEAPGEPEPTGTVTNETAEAPKRSRRKQSE